MVQGQQQTGGRRDGPWGHTRSETHLRNSKRKHFSKLACQLRRKYGNSTYVRILRLRVAVTVTAYARTTKREDSKCCEFSVGPDTFCSMPDAILAHLDIAWSPKTLFALLVQLVPNPFQHEADHFAWTTYPADSCKGSMVAETCATLV